MHEVIHWLDTTRGALSANLVKAVKKTILEASMIIGRMSMMSKSEVAALSHVARGARL